MARKRRKPAPQRAPLPNPFMKIAAAKPKRKRTKR